MTNLLIAIKSCKNDRQRGYHKIIRKTWGGSIWNLRFFMGESILFPYLDLGDDDETFLLVKDDYKSLPQKTKAILSYALIHNYDYTFLCDTDTYLIPDLLMRTGFENYDFSGKIDREIGKTFMYTDVDREGNETRAERYPWASGGFGYFLSRKAARLVADSNTTDWAEDLMVGQVLGPYIVTGDITAKHLQPFANHVSWHFPSTQYKSGYDLKFHWMEEMHAKHGNYILNSCK